MPSATPSVVIERAPRALHHVSARAACGHRLEVDAAEVDAEVLHADGGVLTDDAAQAASARGDSRGAHHVGGPRDARRPVARLLVANRRDRGRRRDQRARMEPSREEALVEDRDVRRDARDLVEKAHLAY
ncbi:MAG: hypothetical protein U0326_05705 [Polyangiales bacterium]